MKRLLFSILFILYSFIVYAQDNSTATKEESFSDKLNKELEDIDKLNYKDYPMTVGLYGGAYFPTDYRDVLGIGGNVGIRYKFNFNKFLALSADLGYTYSSGSSKIFESRFPTIMKEDFHKRGTIEIMAKDLNIVMDMSKTSGTPLLLGTLTKNLFDVSNYTLNNEEDFSAIFKLYKKMIKKGEM